MAKENDQHQTTTKNNERTRNVRTNGSKKKRIQQIPQIQILRTRRPTTTTQIHLQPTKNIQQTRQKRRIHGKIYNNRHGTRR